MILELHQNDIDSIFFSISTITPEYHTMNCGYEKIIEDKEIKRLAFFGEECYFSISPYLLFLDKGQFIFNQQTYTNKSSWVTFCDQRVIYVTENEPLRVVDDDISKKASALLFGIVCLLISFIFTFLQI